MSFNINRFVLLEAKPNDQPVHGTEDTLESSVSICSFLMDEAGLSRWALDMEHPIGREWAERFGVVDVIDLTKVG